MGRAGHSKLRSSEPSDRGRGSGEPGQLGPATVNVVVLFVARDISGFASPLFLPCQGTLWNSAQSCRWFVFSLPTHLAQTIFAIRSLYYSHLLLHSNARLCPCERICDTPGYALPYLHGNNSCRHDPGGMLRSGLFRRCRPSEMRGRAGKARCRATRLPGSGKERNRGKGHVWVLAPLGRGCRV